MMSTKKKSLLFIMLCCAMIGLTPEAWGAESFFGLKLADLKISFRSQCRLDVPIKNQAPLEPKKDDRLINETMYSETPEKKNETAWNELYYRQIRFSLTSQLLEESIISKDYLYINRELDSWSAMKKLPYLFQGSSFEMLFSIGKIIEPQLKIDITF